MQQDLAARGMRDRLPGFDPMLSPPDDPMRPKRRRRGAKGQPANAPISLSPHLSRDFLVSPIFYYVKPPSSPHISLSYTEIHHRPLFPPFCYLSRSYRLARSPCARSAVKARAAALGRTKGQSRGACGVAVPILALSLATVLSPQLTANRPRPPPRSPVHAVRAHPALH
jgi:hypothetical protein